MRTDDGRPAGVYRRRPSAPAGRADDVATVPSVSRATAGRPACGSGGGELSGGTAAVVCPARALWARAGAAPARGPRPGQRIPGWHRPRPPRPRDDPGGPRERGPGCGSPSTRDAPAGRAAWDPPVSGTISRASRREDPNATGWDTLADHAGLPRRVVRCGAGAVAG